MEPAFPSDVSATGPSVWLTRVLTPGCVVIDVGANVGHYTALAAGLVGPTGHVYAFEPAPSNVTLLRKGFESVRHVSVVACAVSDQPGVATLFLDSTNPAQHSLRSGNVGRGGGTVSVSQVTLDQYCDSLTRLDLVKMDAQGAELNILRGAHQLLSRFRPRLVLELWPHGLTTFGTSAAELLDALKQLNYFIYRLSPKGPLKKEIKVLEFLKTAQRWDSINLAAIPKELKKKRRSEAVQ